MNIDAAMVSAMRMADRMQSRRNKETNDHNDRGIFIDCAPDARQNAELLMYGLLERNRQTIRRTHERRCLRRAGSDFDR